ncbi:MAG: hypothetical protein PVF82_12360 [Gammaproteobacteria bacterium]
MNRLPFSTTAFKTVFLLLLVFVFIPPVTAGDVKIVEAKARQQGDGWYFTVTLKHDDTGWDHYADAWRVVTEDGKVLGERTLFHPHVDEQPFTRALGDVKIPAEIKKVYIEAHDKVHGWAKEKYTVNLN